MNRKHLIILMFIILIASAIRFHDPTFRSIWGDEAHSIYRAIEYSQSGIQAATANILKDSHLPAYFLLLSIWIKGFGIGEYSLRLLSIVIGILTVAVFYIFARELFEERTALVSAFLLAISPLAVMHSQELRMYGLMLFFTILSSYYFWRLLSGRKDILSIIGYIIFTILLMLTQIYAILVIAAQFIMLLIEYCKERQLSRGLYILLAQVFIAAIVSPFYLKILLAGLPSAVSGGGDMAFSVFPSYIKPFLFFFVLTLGETVAPWNIPVVVPSIAIFGHLFLRSFKRLSDKKIVFLLVQCLFPVLFAAIFLRPTMPKYLITALPFYLLLIGCSISTIPSRAGRYCLITAITVLQFCSVYNYFNLKEYHNSNQIEPWRKVSIIIISDYHKGDIIITSYRYIVYQILNYYLNISRGGDYSLCSMQNAGSEIVPVPEKILENKRIWLVTHIIDDRVFPADYIPKLKARINKGYKLLRDDRFIPYEETLVSKVPINRHKTGSARIDLRLYGHKQ